MKRAQRSLPLPALLLGALALTTTGNFADAAPTAKPTKVGKPKANTAKKAKPIRPPKSYKKLKAAQKGVTLPAVADFTFKVAVDFKNMHPDNVGKARIECMVYKEDWATVEAEWAKHEYDSNNNSPEAVEALGNYWGWRVGDASTKIPLDANGNFKGKVTVKVNAFTNKDPLDAKSWGCDLKLKNGNHARRGPCSNTNSCHHLQAAEGTALIWRRGGDL